MTPRHLLVSLAALTLLFAPSCDAGGGSSGSGGDDAAVDVAGADTPTPDDAVAGDATDDAAVTPDDGPHPDAVTVDDVVAVAEVTPPGDVTPPPDDVETPPDEDVSTTDPDVGTDGDYCLNETDSAALQTFDVEAEMEAVAMSCYQPGNTQDDKVKQCVVDALTAEDIGLTEGCAGCFAENLLCLAKNCMMMCMMPGQEAQCKACLDEKGCTQDFLNCSGLTEQDLEG